MRVRLPAAFLLLLSSFFLTGGASAHAVLTSSVASVISADHQAHARQILPHPPRSEVGADTGPRFVPGGHAVLPARSSSTRLAVRLPRPADCHDAPPAAGRTTAPARAPPSTAL